MPTALRVSRFALLLGLCAVLAAGCSKSDSDPSSEGGKSGSGSGGGGGGSDLDFVIDGTGSFDAVRCADLWRNDKVRAALKEAGKGHSLEQQYGLKPEEVERLTHGHIRGEDPRVWVDWTIVRTTSAYDEQKVRDKVVGPDFEERTANGKKYLARKLTEQQLRQQEDDKKFNPNAPPPPQPCVCFHGKTVFVTAPTEAAMKKVLEGFPRKKSDGAIADGISKASGGGYQMVSATGKNPGGDGSEGTVVSLSVSGGSWQMEMTVRFTSEDKARAEKDKADKEVNNPAVLEKAGVKSLNVTRNGKEIKATATGDVSSFGKGFFGPSF